MMLRLGLLVAAACAFSASPVLADRPGTTVAARSYEYLIGFELAEDDVGAVQQRHAAVCRSLAAGCRVRSSRFDSSGSASLTLDVAAGSAADVLSALQPPIDDVGGRQTSSSVELKVGGDQQQPTASIVVDYQGVPSRWQRFGEALGEFGPTLRDSTVSTVVFLPALAPWLVVGGLLLLGVLQLAHSAGRRKRGRACAPAHLRAP